MRFLKGQVARCVSQVVFREKSPPAKPVPRYLPAGMQTAVITITSPALPGQAAALQVQAQREANKVYLPFLRY